jgi:hypothetical protein
MALSRGDVVPLKQIQRTPELGYKRVRLTEIPLKIVVANVLSSEIHQHPGQNNFFTPELTTNMSHSYLLKKREVTDSLAV